jgi:hypothetical protein
MSPSFLSSQGLGGEAPDKINLPLPFEGKGVRGIGLNWKGGRRDNSRIVPTIDEPEPRRRLSL